VSELFPNRCVVLLFHFDAGRAAGVTNVFANGSASARFQWRAEDYISFVCKFHAGHGLGFELPVVILMLVKIGVLNYRTLFEGTAVMIVINLFLGAVLTTPEPITQLVMFVPLQLLYEITVWIACIGIGVIRKRTRATNRKTRFKSAGFP